MKPHADAIDVRQLITTSLIEMFSMMIALEAKPVAESEELLAGERVTGCIAVVGATVSGTVYVHLPDGLAKLAAGKLLRIKPEELDGGAEVNDVVGEICNIVAGKLKSALTNAGEACGVSTPTIIRGTSFAVESTEILSKESVYFECLNHKLCVEVHLKHSQPCRV